ncbi:hypothetical protein U1Q18_002748, partial [Sarracenia purpurea var. burkii]
CLQPCVFVRASSMFKLVASLQQLVREPLFCLLLESMQNQCSFLLVAVLAAAWVFAVADMRLDAF